MSHLLFLLRFVKHRWLGNALSITRNECRGRDVYWPQILLWINMSTLLPLCSCWHFVPLENLRLVSSSWTYMGKVWTWSCPLSTEGWAAPDLMSYLCTPLSNTPREMVCLVIRWIGCSLRNTSQQLSTMPPNSITGFHEN